jgi:thiol:disulfide interchange protein
MNRSMGLVLWGLAISALGLWHIVTWVQNTDADKGVYKLSVGIFCLLIGILVIAFQSKLRGKRKDD